MKRVRYVLIGAVAGAALALLIVSPRVAPLVSSATASPSAHAATSYRELALFGKVFDAVRQHYVDKPDANKMIQSALAGMVSGLDPHSNYMDAKDFDEMRVETSGQLCGLC